MNAVRGLKLLSAVMAVLIIGGLGLLGYGVYSKLGGSVKGDAAEMATEAEAPTEVVAEVRDLPRAVGPLKAFGTLGLDQPAGSRIIGVTTDGPLMTLRIADGGQDDRVVVIDLGAGRVIGTVHVGGSAAAVQ